MVFTRIPSSVLLASVAFARSFGVAAARFPLREGIMEMDVDRLLWRAFRGVRPPEEAGAS